MNTIDAAAEAAIKNAGTVRMVKDKDGKEWPVTELELFNGQWFHFEDGFFVAEELPADMPVNDKASFEKAMERIFNADSALIQATAEYDAILEGKQRAIKKATDRVEWLKAYMGTPMEMYAKTQMKEGGPKTVECPYGAVSFRTNPERLAVADPGAALNWAKLAAPEAVELIPAVEKFKVSELPKEKKLLLMASLRNGSELGEGSKGFQLNAASESMKIETTVARNASRREKAKATVAKEVGAEEE